MSSTDWLREIIVNHTSEMLDNPGENDIYPTTKFYNNLEQAILTYIDEHYVPKETAKADEFNYKRLKKLESDSIDTYAKFNLAKAGTTERVVAFIHQLSPWNLQRGIDTINDLYTPNSEIEKLLEQAVELDRTVPVDDEWHKLKKVKAVPVSVIKDLMDKELE